MKHYFKKGLNENDLVVPTTEQSLKELKECRLVNPCAGNPHGLKEFDFDNIEEYANEILDVRLQVEKGIYPAWFMDKYYPFEGEPPSEMPEPLKAEFLSFEDPQGLADVVHMDSPTDAPRACHKWLMQVGATIKNDPTKYIDFLGAVPAIEENIADGVKRALYDGFEAKYYFWVARPEEILKKKTGVYPNLFTAYPEGCPNHPSYPAGHGSAVAGGIRRLMEHFELNDYQLKQLLDTAYLWAMFRSLAGVHYAVDNVAGLAIGGLDKYFTKEAKETYLV